MRILILHEGRAGHSNQSRAISMAFGRFFAVEETRVFCKLRIGVFQKPLRLLLNLTRAKLPLCLFRLFHNVSPLPTESPDLIISAGGGTVYANAWLAKYYNRPNLFCGELRGLKPILFKAVVTGFQKYHGKIPYIISPTPVPIEASTLAAAAVTFRERSGIGDSRCWSMLAGGNGAGYLYSADDWRAIADGMKRLAEKHNIRWLITTSRRSGKAAEDAISSAIDKASIAATHYAFGSEKNISYHEILGAAERHFVTEDSHMMISEAIASGRPVHSLSPVQHNTHHTNQYFLDLYTQNGWLQRHFIRDMAEIDFHTATNSTTVNSSVMDELSAILFDWWNSLDT
jgi:uncharacterized protein